MKKCLMITVLLSLVAFANAKNISKKVAGTLVITNKSSNEVEIEYLFRSNGDSLSATKCSKVESGTGSQIGEITVEPRRKKKVKLNCCLESIAVIYGTRGGTVESRVIKTDCSKMYKVILDDYKGKLSYRDYAITAKINGKLYDILDTDIFTTPGGTVIAAPGLDRQEEPGGGTVAPR